MPTSVLIVDDHAAFRRFAGRLLEAAGFVVAGEAEDGASALAAVEKLRPDVVLLDVLLPDTTGFDVARELAGRKQRPLVLLTSSRTASDLGDLVRSDHVSRFISKSELTVAALAGVAGDAA
jgi:CheY-like chemotaxis protein